MNTGIRATYILLEEVKAQLLRQNAAPGNSFRSWSIDIFRRAPSDCHGSHGNQERVKCP
jgi:hypothetical protein